MNSTTLSTPTAETGDHNVMLTPAIAVQSGGWSPDELRAMVAQEIELRSIIVDYYRSQMIDKKHSVDRKVRNQLSGRYTASTR